MSKVSQSRSWMVTLSEELYSQSVVEAELANYVYVGQLEVGESGYRHWQILIENKNPVKFSTLQGKFPKGHFEPRRESKEAALKYVTKEETFAGVRIGNGLIETDVKQGERTDLTAMREGILYQGKSVERVLLENPTGARFVRELEALSDAVQYEKTRGVERDVTVKYLWGKTGVGKTRLVYDTFGYDDVFRVTAWKNPFDAYRYQKVLVLDEFRSQLDFSYLLKLLDRYPLELPARFRNKHAAFDTVWMISNVPLEQQYKDIQRYEPESWQALLRRIDSVEEMTGKPEPSKTAA